MLSIFNDFDTDKLLAAAFQDTSGIVRVPLGWEAKDSWMIEVDMPGVPKEKIDLKLVGRTLEIRGERMRSGKPYEYRQTFTLPESVRSAEGISATTENGVLTIKIPKQTTKSTFQIPVN